MADRYYSLYECFEMAANADPKELLADLPEADRIASRLVEQAKKRRAARSQGASGRANVMSRMCKTGALLN
jgi:hypothetical protein